MRRWTIGNAKILLRVALSSKFPVMVIKISPEETSPRFKALCASSEINID